MDFELPSPEELSALELDAQLWPEEYEDDGSDWRASRVSGWLEATSGIHSPCLRDSPLLGFYNDPTVDRAMDGALDDDEDNWLDRAGPSDADARLLRAMASCPDLREGANGDVRRAREDWRREKAIRTQLEEQEADRRRARDADRHQSDPYASFSAPPPSPITTSRPVSRVIHRAASREWRNGLYAPSLEDIADADAPALALSSAVLGATADISSDPRSITPTPISVVIPSASSHMPIDLDTELPYARDGQTGTLSTPTSPVRHRPSPITVPERENANTPRPEDMFFLSQPTQTQASYDAYASAQGLPLPSTPQSATRARSGSAGTTDSRTSSALVPTPALSFSVSSPSASESKFEDSDDEEDSELKDTLSPPILPFVLRKARWSFGSSSKVSLATTPESSPLTQEVKIFPSPKPSRSAPSLFERAARRLSSNPPPRPTEDAAPQGIAFPVQRSPSHRKSRRPTTADSSRDKPTPSLMSSFLSEDPFASNVGVLASPPTSPKAGTNSLLTFSNIGVAIPSANLAVPAGNIPKRKTTRSFSNFSLKAAIESITHRKSSVSKTTAASSAAPSPLVTSPVVPLPSVPAPAPPRAPAMHKSHSSISTFSGSMSVQPVLVVSGLATRMTDDEGLIRTIAAWATGLVRVPASKIRRRSDGAVHVHFRQVVDVAEARIPPSAVIPSLGEVKLMWIHEETSAPAVPPKDVGSRMSSRPGTANANAADPLSMAGLSVMPIIPGAMMAIR